MLMANVYSECLVGCPVPAFCHINLWPPWLDPDQIPDCGGWWPRAGPVSTSCVVFGVGQCWV